SWATGIRLAVRRARGGRAHHERRDGAAHGAYRTPRESLDLGCRRPRRRDADLRVVDGFLVGLHRARVHWRDRHGEHGYSQRRASARNARPAARTHDWCEHGVLHRRAAAWGTRGRAGRQLVGCAVLGDQRRHRLPPGHRLDYLDHAVAETLPPRVCARRNHYCGGLNSTDTSGTSVILTPGVSLTNAFRSSTFFSPARRAKPA